MNNLKHARQLTFLATFSLLVNLSHHLDTAHAQGALTPPPGVPAPVMKTLDQIEPRIAVNTLPGTNNGMFVINAPGNYYLTANVVATAGKHGILINADNVKLDLNGFAIIGTAAAGYHGITLLNDDGGDGENLSVRNGEIRNWEHGIGFFSRGADVIEDLRIRGCKAGINLYNAINVRRCYVFGTSSAYYGINITSGFSRVEDCTVVSVNGLTTASGIELSDGHVSRCEVRGISGNPARGIKIEQPGGIVENCRVHAVYGSAAGTIGIEATTVRDCTVVEGFSLASGASLTGIAAQHVERCTVKNISGGLGGGKGIGIAGAAAGGLIEHCLVDGISGGAAIGINTGTNRFSVNNSRIQNVSGSGVNSFGIQSTSGTLKASGCDVTTVSNATGNAWGIYSQGGMIDRCNVSRTKSDGIYANGLTHVQDCTVTSCGTAVGEAGIWASSTRNHLEGNYVSGCPVGIQILGGSSGTVIRNTCVANTSNYQMAGSGFMPVATAANAGTATNPFINLSW